MALRGFLLCIQSALFVLLPGYIMFRILRRAPRVKRALVWWGAGGLLLALLPQYFFVSLARQVLNAWQGAWVNVAQWSVTALLVGVCVEGMKYLLLKYRHVDSAELVASGLAVGLGAGFIYQIFQGFVTMGMGTRLLLGDISTPELYAVAATPVVDLGLAALNWLAYRLAFLLCNACLGVVVGQALLRRQMRRLGLAMLLHAGVELAYTALTEGLGGRGLWPVLAALVFECTLAVVSWRWLARQPLDAP